MELVLFKEIDVTEGLIRQQTEKFHEWHSSPSILWGNNRGVLGGGGSAIYGEEERIFDNELNGTGFLSNFGNHLQANTI